jgi:hypothetical protein
MRRSDLQLVPVISGGSAIYPGHEWTGDGAQYLSDTSIPTPVFHSAVPGVYELIYTVTDHHGSQGTSIISVTVFERPTVNITGDGLFPLVCGGTELQLDGNPSGGSGSYDDTPVDGPDDGTKRYHHRRSGVQYQGPRHYTPSSTG